MFYNSLCKHGPARQNFGASASGVQLGRAGIVARRLVRVKEQIEDKTTSLLVQIDNRIRMLVMLQIMMLNISSPVYVITKISAIISRYLTAKFEQ